MVYRIVGLRTTFLAVLALDLALVTANALSYPRFCSEPGSRGTFAGLVAVLLAYAGGVLVITRSASAQQRRILELAAAAGLALGGVEMINIAVEDVQAAARVP